MTREEERIWIRADRAYANACAERGGPILDHMSTANVARDMDLLRQAVGDGKMTFVGYSYGSHVGSTYANMFFGKVRAVVIDGVMDPVSFTTGRGDQARTSPPTPACAASRVPTTPSRRSCDSATSAAPTAPSPAATPSGGMTGWPSGCWPTGFAGVWCLDPINPDHPSAWARAARRADRRDPYFGRPWNWFGSICGSWPGKDRDRYLGPFNRRTANTVLVVGTVNDPATRYQTRSARPGCSGGAAS